MAHAHAASSRGTHRAKGKGLTKAGQRTDTFPDPYRQGRTIRVCFLELCFLELPSNLRDGLVELGILERGPLQRVQIES